MATLVNDIHSQLNPTRVARVVIPNSLAELQRLLEETQRERQPICVAGGRHAMGAQQFGTDAVLVDTRQLRRVLSFDYQRGFVDVEAGIQWPELVGHLLESQTGRAQQWSIAQKQTGADRLSIGGAIAANAHGRGLRMKPMIADVESFTLLNARGKLLHCDRRDNGDLFRLVIGGYGLFGIVYSIMLRLAPRRKLERVVECITTDELPAAFEQRIKDGFLYGDFQFQIDDAADDFLRRGVFSCYRPAAATEIVSAHNKELSDGDWKELLYLAHADKARGFQRYTDHYLSTSGQIYWSDAHQLSPYFDDYHRDVDKQLGASHPATEMITELYVPRHSLPAFMEEARSEFRRSRGNVIYGTVRLIERDDESFLAWAKQSYACIIFNLCVTHTSSGIAGAKGIFRRLIDLAMRHGGSFYLTYHKFATRQQVETCYPQFVEFLRLKKQHDPDERFQSDWYRHHCELFSA
jgi:FAD/FMN-containing dehydrogenase